MREIKFRVWDRLSERFLNTDGYYFSADFKEFTAFDRYFDTKDEGLVIQQFTGRKDKNGKEIYEGDIVSTKNGKKEVIYSEDIASFECVCAVGARALYGYHRDNDLLVVGNIFDNPLLQPWNNYEQRI